MRRRSAPWLFPTFALAAVLGAAPAFAQFFGNLAVTDPSGNPLADNIFATRSQVFFTGGPADPSCSIGALPDGIYAFQVTDAAGTSFFSRRTASRTGCSPSRAASSPTTLRAARTSRRLR